VALDHSWQRQFSRPIDFVTCAKRKGLAYNVVMLEEGFWAEIQIGGEHLRLFAEESPQGCQASVYNMKTKTWLMPSESAASVENGKDLAEKFATRYLKEITSVEVPRLEWKKSRAV
jgi:hypothetical protein